MVKRKRWETESDCCGLQISTCQSNSWLLTSLNISAAVLVCMLTSLSSSFCHSLNKVNIWVCVCGDKGFPETWYLTKQNKNSCLTASASSGQLRAPPFYCTKTCKFSPLASIFKLEPVHRRVAVTPTQRTPSGNVRLYNWMKVKWKILGLEATVRVRFCDVTDRDWTVSFYFQRFGRTGGPEWLWQLYWLFDSEKKKKTVVGEKWADFPKK